MNLSLELGTNLYTLLDHGLIVVAFVALGRGVIAMAKAGKRP